MEKKEEGHEVKQIPIKDSPVQDGNKKKKRNKNKKRKIAEIDPADEQPKKKQNTNSGVNKSYLDVFGPNAKPDLTLKLEAVKKNDIKIRDIQSLVLWVLGDGTSPSWAFVKNKALISKVVVVALPGLSLPMFEKASELNILNKEKGLRAVFTQPYECKAPGSNNRVYDAISVFTFKSVKTKEGNGNKDQKEPEKPSSDLNPYLLSPAQLNENNYPMPNALACREFFNMTEHFKKNPSPNPDAKLKAIAIDCEMCITKVGFELTRASIVDEEFNTLYDEYVMPENAIMDYNTRYSGITAESLQGITRRVKDVQQDLLKFMDSNTVLVGHSLENDLQALNIIYNKVIDTALLYPHSRGENYKNSLRFLSQRFLHTDIQGQGHDSVQDAVTAMKLAKLKVENGPSFGITEPDSESIFRSVSVSSNTRSCLVDNSWVCKQHTYSTVDCIPTASDEETMKKVLAQVKPNHASKFVWAQFHGLESYYQDRVRTSKDAPSASGDEPPMTEGIEEGEIPTHSGQVKIIPVTEDINEMLSDEKCIDILRSYDEYVQNVYEQMPNNGMLVVITGHGNLPKIKKMMWQKQNSHENWKDGSDELLQQEIDACRKGLFFFKIKIEDNPPSEEQNNTNGPAADVPAGTDQKMEEDKTN